MKPSYIILLVIGLVFLIGGLVYVFHDQPSLSADEVKAIVKDKYKVGINDIYASYSGDGKWTGYFIYHSVSNIDYTHEWYYFEKTRTFGLIN